MIYRLTYFPSRIKGEEWPLRKGDIVVCITNGFKEFTYGKQYTLYGDVRGSLLPMIQIWVTNPCLLIIVQRVITFYPFIYGVN